MKRRVTITTVVTVNTRSEDQAIDLAALKFSMLLKARERKEDSDIKFRVRKVTK